MSTKVVVTAFGPFGGAEENPSEAIVNKITSLPPIGNDIELITDILAVNYEQVNQRVPQLWKKHSPTLMVAVGVSGASSKICIEQRSFKLGYCRKDINGDTPTNNSCSIGSDKRLETNLNVQKLVDSVNEQIAADDIIVVPSENPGRYLCAYSYYTSLCINRDRSLFVHVPWPNKILTVEVQAQILRAIVAAALKQLGIEIQDETSDQ